MPRPLVKASGLAEARSWLSHGLTLRVQIEAGPQSKFIWPHLWPIPQPSSSREKGVHEPLGLEVRQVIRLLARSHEAHGDAQLVAHGEDHATLGGAVQLRQQHARHTHRLRE